MSNYSYFYVKTIFDGTDNSRTYKFLKGNPTLFKPPEDTWSTYGRYNLLSRLLRGGLSGSGDIHHPANAVFKVRVQSIKYFSIIIKTTNILNVIPKRPVPETRNSGEPSTNFLPILSSFSTFSRLMALYSSFTERHSSK